MTHSTMIYIISRAYSIYIYEPGVVFCFLSSLRTGCAVLGRRSWTQAEPVFGEGMGSEEMFQEKFSVLVGRLARAFLYRYVTTYTHFYLEMPRDFSRLLISYSRIHFKRLLFSNQVSYNDILKFSSSLTKVITAI